ncbi:Lrp/AsnC ligand binding domain-containing protein [Halopenitus salinus]|jgi:DNA-binding Lrp family transcriptional regulator|uniref:Lrp/AsnC ligand binding domain-containing protein n=1 Tax=Halopenitus salinus TaxID=1198295 RepID=A0ABD5UYF7_9EURY
MVRAYVLLKADVGAAAGIAEASRSVEPVETAHVVAGDWDVIVEIETPEVYDVLSTAATRLQELSGVVDTKTYVAIDEE